MFYFYDGETETKDGIIELPLDHPEWIQRAWVMGYRLNPDTEETVLLADALVAQTTDDSSEEQDESSDNGRQPDGDNGVRESQSRGNGDAPKRRTRSSVRSGTRKSR